MANQQSLTSTYDFVLLPDQTLNEKAIDLSKQLADSYPTRFTLDETTVPHYSIYMAELERKEVEEAKTRAKDIAARFSPFDLKVFQYWQDPVEGFFEVQYERTPKLIELQKAIIDQINPLRHEKFLKSYPPGYTKDELESQLTGNALEQLRKYGYPEIGEDYRPHMTFTRLIQKSQSIINTQNLLPASAFSGLYTALGLFVMGENGTCVEQVAIYPFVDKSI